MLYCKKGATRDAVIEHFDDHEINGVGKEMASGTIVWYKYQHDYSMDYLTFKSKEDGTTFKFSGSSSSNLLQYSLDDGANWTVLTHNTNSPAVASGDSIMFKAIALTIDSTKGIGQFSSTGEFGAEGNVMSLLFGDGFIGQTSLAGKASAFTYLFSACTGLTTAENLSLPATTLDYRCYWYMFRGCTSLTTAPELPATTLAYYCYSHMFDGCTSLTTAPELPATTLAKACYHYMFYNCTSLTTAPELPATTLADWCYYFMFRGCTSLNYVKCLASSGMTSDSCLSTWLASVASSGTFVKSPNATTGDTAWDSQWRLNNSSGIPSGWTVVDAS